MGACDFRNVGTGKTAREAFSHLVTEAKFEHGHGGYTGTIAEKDGFVLIDVPTGVEPRTYADFVLVGQSRRYVPATKEKHDRAEYLKDGTIKFTRGEIVEIPDVLKARVERDSAKVDDKWGPAGCVALGEGRWLFFGMASS